jgi:hypothetical protein
MSIMYHVAHQIATRIDSVKKEKTKMMSVLEALNLFKEAQLNDVFVSIMVRQSMMNNVLLKSDQDVLDVIEMAKAIILIDKDKHDSVIKSTSLPAVAEALGYQNIPRLRRLLDERLGDYDFEKRATKILKIVEKVPADKLTQALTKASDILETTKEPYFAMNDHEYASLASMAVDEALKVLSDAMQIAENMK